MSPRNRRDEQGGAPIATYPLGSRSQFCRGRKPECPEETLQVRLRSTETQSTYNIVVEVEGVIDVHYASLTSEGVQHRVFYRDGHPSRYQPHPTGLNFGEQTGAGVFPLVIAVPLCYSHRLVVVFSHYSHVHSICLVHCKVNFLFFFLL